MLFITHRVMNSAATAGETEYRGMNFLETMEQNIEKSSIQNPEMHGAKISGEQ